MKKESKCEEITIAPWINSHQPRQIVPAKAYAVYEKMEPAANYQQVTGMSWKKKAVAVAALAVTTFGIGMWLCNGYIVSPPEVVPVRQPEFHVVEPGDTLWSIAGEHVDDSQDIRQVYYDIMADNRIGHDENIYPGQKLIIKF